MSQLTNLFSDIATAIRAKTGSQSQMVASDFPQLIMGIPTGGGGGGGASGSPDAAVRFYDYDGTLITTYSKSDFLALSAMPASPTHAGLISQGWNWSLSDAQSYVSTYDKLEIGQLYSTNDGSTRLHIEVTDILRKLTLYYTVSSSSAEASINWGDGTSETNTGSTSHTITHEYAFPGNYTISITLSTGYTMTIAGSSSSSSLLLRIPSGVTTSNELQITYASMLKRIELGENCIIGTYAFSKCYSLESVVIPPTSAQSYVIDNNSFRYCCNLKHVTLPNNVHIKDYAFMECYSMKSISFSATAYKIGTTEELSHSSVERITFPFSFSDTSGYIDFPSNLSLNDVVLPQVPSNGAYFSGCKHLTNLTLGNTAATSDAYVGFGSNLGTLRELKFVGRATGLGSNAFASNECLEYLPIPAGSTTLGASCYSQCKSAKSVSIPSTVTSIGNGAFGSCYSLTSCTIPNSVTSLGTGIFGDCYSLRGVTFPNRITTIPASTFIRCYQLEEFDVPSTVTSIGANAFTNCRGIKKIDFSNHSSVPTVSSDGGFPTIHPNAKIIVPDALYDTWITVSPWSNANILSHIVKASEA